MIALFLCLFLVFYCSCLSADSTFMNIELYADSECSTTATSFGISVSGQCEYDESQGGYYVIIPNESNYILNAYLTSDCKGDPITSVTFDYENCTYSSEGYYKNFYLDWNGFIEYVADKIVLFSLEDGCPENDYTNLFEIPDNVTIIGSPETNGNMCYFLDSFYVSPTCSYDDETVSVGIFSSDTCSQSGFALTFQKFSCQQDVLAFCPAVCGNYSSFDNEACSGNGICSPEGCLCEENWTGDYCDTYNDDTDDDDDTDDNDDNDDDKDDDQKDDDDDDSAGTAISLIASFLTLCFTLLVL